MQGAITSLSSLATVFGPIVFTQTFAYFITESAPLHLPGAAFLLAAMLIMLGFVLGWRATIGLKPLSAETAAAAEPDPPDSAELPTLIEAEFKS